MMYMQRINTKKGEYGYIAGSRIVWSALTLLMLAAVFAMYFVPKAYYGTNRNLFTILAALMCLPAGKMAVRVIMLFRAATCGGQTRHRIEETLAAMDTPPAAAYELYMTSYEKNFALSHAAASDSCVIALTEDAACDTAAGEAHIRAMLENSGLHGYTVKIFRDPGQYTTRLSRLANTAGTAKPADAMNALMSASL